MSPSHSCLMSLNFLILHAHSLGTLLEHQPMLGKQRRCHSHSWLIHSVDVRCCHSAARRTRLQHAVPHTSAVTLLQALLRTRGKLRSYVQPRRVLQNYSPLLTLSHKVNSCCWSRSRQSHALRTERDDRILAEIRNHNVLLLRLPVVPALHPGQALRDQDWLRLQ